MPRGNDPEALKELHATYGEGGHIGNADDLIRAHQATRSQALTAALLISEDYEATARLDLAKIEPPDGEKATCIAASVHGEYLVAVFEPESKRVWKEAMQYAPKKHDGESRSKIDPEIEAEVARYRASLLAKASA